MEIITNTLMALIVTCSVAFGADEEKKPLIPSELLPVLSQYEKEVTAAKDAFDKMVAKATEKADIAMDGVKKKYMAGSDAEGLLLVVQQQKDLKANVTLEKVLENIKKNSVENLLAPKVDIRKDLVGKLRIVEGRGFSCTWTVDPTLRCVRGDGTSGNVILDKDGTITISQADGWKMTGIIWNSAKNAFTGKQNKPTGEFWDNITITKIVK